MNSLEDTDLEELPHLKTTKMNSTLRALFDHAAAGETVNKSGSNWGPQEIELFRISYKDLRDPLWEKSQRSPPICGKLSWAKFIEESDSLPRLTNTEIRFRFAELSGFFIALANLLRTPTTSIAYSTGNSPRQLKRAGNQTPRPEQASKQSIYEIIGSSSPLPDRSSSQASSYDPQLSASNCDLEDERDRKQAEVASSSLASEFISLVIDLFLDQSSSREKHLAFKEAPTRFDLVNANNSVNCKCFDDGSIIWHEQNRGSKEWTLGGHVCSVETKPSFTTSDEEGKGKISPDMIPQYACELIGPVMENLESGRLDLTTDQWYVSYVSAT